MARFAPVLASHTLTLPAFSPVTRVVPSSDRAGKYAGFGLGGALLFGLGVVFLEIGVLRVLQEQTGEHLTGNWSWVPYAVVVVVFLVMAGLIWTIANRTSRRRRAS